MTRVLLVEDDEMLRRSLTFFLKSKGFDVVAIDNGLDALEYIEEKGDSIDLIITDLNLPFAGGKQVVHAAKKSANQQIKIIVLTSSGIESTELEMFDLGADEFISKPFSPPILLKRIENLIH